MLADEADATAHEEHSTILPLTVTVADEQIDECEL